MAGVDDLITLASPILKAGPSRLFLRRQDTCPNGRSRNHAISKPRPPAAGLSNLISNDGTEQGPPNDDGFYATTKLTTTASSSGLKKSPVPNIALRPSQDVKTPTFILRETDLVDPLGQSRNFTAG